MSYTLGPRLLLDGERRKITSPGKARRSAGGWPGFEPRQKNMRAKLNGHAPKTEEIFPPLRPAHDHQKGAQIMEKILFFYFNSARTVFEIALAPYKIQSGDKTRDRLGPGTVSSIRGLSPETRDVWSPYSILDLVLQRYCQHFC